MHALASWAARLPSGSKSIVRAYFDVGQTGRKIFDYLVSPGKCTSLPRGERLLEGRFARWTLLDCKDGAPLIFIDDRNIKPGSIIKQFLIVFLSLSVAERPMRNTAHFFRFLHQNA